MTTVAEFRALLRGRLDDFTPITDIIDTEQIDSSVEKGFFMNPITSNV